MCGPSLLGTTWARRHLCSSGSVGYQKLEGKTGVSPPAVLGGGQGRQWDKASAVMLVEKQVLTMRPCNVNVDVDPDKFFQSLLNQKQALFRYFYFC